MSIDEGAETVVELQCPEVISPGMKNRDRQFVVGIGAQRCGTTLLHKALDSISDVYMHPIKELHYFDCRFKPADDSFRQLQRRLARRKLKSKKFWHGRIGRERVRRKSQELIAYKEQCDYEYFELFDRIPARYRYVGEVTPRYALLPSDQIQYMREVLGEAKIIFSKRDPLKRLISAFKLRTFRFSNRADKAELGNAELDELFLKLLSEETGWISTQRRLNDYEGTLARYREHFADVLVLDYEHFSTSTDFRNILESFLGLEIDPVLFDNRMGTRYNSFDSGYQPSGAVIERLVNVFELESG